GDDGHAAAADQAVVPAVVVVEVEAEELRFRAAVTERSQGLALDFGLDAAAAEGAGLAAVGENDHGGARLLRRRTACLDDGAVDAAAAGVDGISQLREQFTHGSLYDTTRGVRRLTPAA